MNSYYKKMFLVGIMSATILSGEDTLSTIQGHNSSKNENEIIQESSYDKPSLQSNNKSSFDECV